MARKSSITKRWIINNLGMVFLTIMVIELVFVYAIQYYYYNSVKQYLSSRINAVTSILSIYSQDNASNFSSEMRNMLETFDEKDKIELMAVNSKGRVVLTSSGFSPDDTIPMPDYLSVMSGEEGYWLGKQPSGEKIMAVSVPLQSISSEYSAVRMVVSLTEIDNTIQAYIFAAAGIGIFIMLIMIFTGLYFIGSIVRPIQQISLIAKRFATGDFSVRIKNNEKDEIGELCTSVNYMADELSNTESMKNEFISSVSHELRTPLTAIKGWAETIYSEENPETMKKGVEEAPITEGKRLTVKYENARPEKAIDIPYKNEFVGTDQSYTRRDTDFAFASATDSNVSIKCVGNVITLGVYYT